MDTISNLHTAILRNGIRILHLENSNRVGHFGWMVHAGSRDELENEQGLAHFIEHTVFKGTRKRKAFHILSRLEDVGGELNAYTSKEETVIHSTFLTKDYPRAIELIYDIAFESVFPEKELQREKEVIIEEINSYKDSPAELIFDEFEELLYPNDPLGRNILGDKKTVSSFGKSHIQEYIQRNYRTNRMALVSTGNIRFSKLLKIIEKYFDSVPASNGSKRNIYKGGYKPTEKIIRKSTHQAHCAIGNIGPGLHDEERLSAHMLTNLLGGAALNSRLNLALRERNGLAYNVEAMYTPYIDTGYASIYFGADKENLKKSFDIVIKELKKLQNTALGNMQLFKAKRQLIGQIAISSENNENLMLNLGKSLLVYDKVDPLSELYHKIEAINSADLMQTANRLFNEKELTTLIYQ